MWTWVACHDSAHGRVRMASAFDKWVPIDKHANSHTLWMSLSSKWQLSQQRHAAARSTVASRKNVKETAIQLLSPVLGSVAAVALVALGLDGAGTVVLVTLVLVVMFVLGDVAAGFIAATVVGSVPGCSAAGPAPPSGRPSRCPAHRTHRSPPPEAWRHRAQPSHAVPRLLQHPQRH